MHTDGSATVIRASINHKLLSLFISDTLAVEIDSLTDPFILSTLYQPPARNYFPIFNFNLLFRKNAPLYMIVDLNANHPIIGNRFTNKKGRRVHNLISHVGPNFPT